MLGAAQLKSNSQSILFNQHSLVWHGDLVGQGRMTNSGLLPLLIP